MNADKFATVFSGMTTLDPHVEAFIVTSSHPIPRLGNICVNHSVSSQEQD